MGRKKGICISVCIFYAIRCSCGNLFREFGIEDSNDHSTAWRLLACFALRRLALSVFERRKINTIQTARVC